MPYAHDEMHMGGAIACHYCHVRCVFLLIKKNLIIQ